ncbi:LuxR family transcriptional regulator [Pectobacterium zantedeschiae]|uniref:LuxR family transcriptional regulator n=1 Tax=Pectobacterium zantedeschiae TaxID=2034769 RepID=A0A9X8JJW9_9GAMM|nr:LuxR family transcriptional regulator [Pectobacterium zantedeschiae]RYC38356.1 LuxR family transcriptional regulator [Pectobacterium zantedeschiae]RYC45001.1 LuxR family transcriptional regulator [Pectobacterium zantedeschiae]
MSVFCSDNEIINNTIKSYLSRKLKQYGDLKYAYMIMNKKNPSQVVIISNYPQEWVNTYKENNYQHIDPVILTAINKVSPFSWEDNIVINSKLKFSKIFNLSKEYDIVNGYTFVLHDNNNNLAALSIMFEEHVPTDMESIVEGNKDKLQMLLITTHEKITTLYKEMTQNTQSKKQGDKEIFSQRENEILYWASMGKTYPEIALILDIKISTVKFHIGNVVKKLGVLNAKHAIRLGVELQLIKPEPL